MRYISTRGGMEPVSFTEAVMTGLAPDGGLLLPGELPAMDMDRLRRLRDGGEGYAALAHAVIAPFADDIPPRDLEDMIRRSCAAFTHPRICPLRQVGDMHVLELFHGPTLAFKDVALQLLGNLFEYLLARDGQTMNILGATSGDTGSAAIHGVRGKEGINIFILHPQGRVSPVQEMQMTTVLDDNVFNIAIQGTFDHGQAIVKAIFNDLEFKRRHRLGAINSINWARVLAQVVYYVHAWLEMEARGHDSVEFSVPTGNFGDIFAGYLAGRLLPAGAVRRLILATNSNDILTRLIQSGDYSRGEVTPTRSPSMDIQAASNLERYLYYLLDQDHARVRAAMERFEAGGALDLSAFKERMGQDFAACRVSEEETLETIARWHGEYGYLLDPHTAVGVRAAERLGDADAAVICLATAHPAKFAEAVREATGQDPEPPPALAGLHLLPSRCEILPAEVEPVKDFVAAHAI